MTDSPADEAPEEREKPFWQSFTQADIKLLMVTFIGTVAANIVTVIVVAVAVVLVRSSAHPKATGRSVLTATLFALLDLAIVLFCVFAFAGWVDLRWQAAGVCGSLCGRK
jgi:hypothetical protein